MNYHGYSTENDSTENDSVPKMFNQTIWNFDNTKFEKFTLLYKFFYTKFTIFNFNWYAISIILGCFCDVISLPKGLLKFDRRWVFESA